VGRGRPIDPSLWPGEGPHRAFLELLDRVHRENGTKSLADIAAAMNLRARSRVSALLRGQAVPADEDQARELIRALGGGTEDQDRGLKLYRKVRASFSLTARPVPAGRGDAHAVGGPGKADRHRRREGEFLVAGEGQDLEALVHPAVVSLPYIRRDIEDEIRADLDSGQPVLLVGSSMVGKTRMATTLIKEVLGARRLIIPDSKDFLASLTVPGATPRNSMIFLDDIQQLIGAGGITQTALRHLAEENVIVGTIRALVYDQYQPTDELRPLEWDVLRVFKRVPVFRDLSPSEQERLYRVVNDEGTRERILRTGIGEYVGAAERIAEALRLGPSVSPVGLALVQGAADWARAGMSTPVPASLLPVLAAPHLDARNRLLLGDRREYRTALQWATRPINPTVSLLQREQDDAFSVFEYALDLLSGQDDEIPESTWPVLIQHAGPADLLNIGRTATAAGRPEAAEQAWRRAEETGDREAAPWAALFLGAQLRQQGDVEGAQAAYQRAIATGHADAAPGAMFNLGNLLKQQNDRVGAKDAYQRAVDSGHPRVVALAAVGLGRLLARQGDLAGARDAYQRALDSDLDIGKLEARIRTLLAERADAQTRPVYLSVIDARRWRADPEAVATAALELGELLAGQGDAEGARQAYLRAADSGEVRVAPTAMLMLGNLHRDLRDIDAAKAAFHRAMDSGDDDIAPKAASNLGIMLYEEGDIEGARVAFQYAADAGHAQASPLAAFNLGVLLAENGDTDGARDAYQRAAAFQNAAITKDAMRRTLQLGILLAEKGDLNGARMAYHAAVGFGSPVMAPWPMMNLAIALSEHGDAETARAASQKAADSGHPPVAAAASVLLGGLLEGHGDTAAARDAYQRAVDSAYPEVVAAASLGLGGLLAEQGDIAAARGAFQRALRSENKQIAEEAARSLRALP
jgi:tetratricopeptide (TPR) repeat protein